MSDILALSAREMARAIRERRLSPVETMQAVLDRMDAGRSLNAFITVVAEQALADAKRAEDAVMQGAHLPPLHGIPYSVKDLLNTAGVRTTMGSALFADNIPKEDAVAVARAKQAGAILIGKTTTPEFGHKQLTEGPIFGLTLNPINRSVTCGASSGGAAVALAAGMGPLALGTDGGGSIRIPAACCGVVGFKATLGAIPHLQVPDLFSANSFAGPMARDVADTALFYDVLAGPDRLDPFGQARPQQWAGPDQVKGLRVGWMPRCGNSLLDPEVEWATQAAVQSMAESGAIVEQIELDFVSLEPHFLVMLESAIASRVAPRMEAFRTRLDPHLITTVEAGLRHSAVDLQNAGAARSGMFREVQAMLQRFDVIVSPVLTAPPAPLDERLPDGPVLVAGQESGRIRGGWYPYTFPFNLTGHPALALPCGKTQAGLPIGLQIVGAWYSDQTLLKIAMQVEQLLAGRWKADVHLV
ncbi:amidase [Acidisoma cellulosilyticum]|nr:amidase family protein [Acidisoma cellulosilyticum]